MNAPVKLSAFAALLAALAAGGAVAGGAVDPDRAEPAPAEAAHTEERTEGHGGAKMAGHPVRGLAVAEDGLRVVVDDADLERGRAEELRFRIVDDAGRTVRNFDVEHEKRMHLIVARRDLTGFEHLHPTQDSDGTWRTDVRLDEAGSYRLFADFSSEDEPHTLASDLRVDGEADLQPLPPPATTAVSDGGYDVALDGGDAHPGEEAELRFTISKDGKPVDVEPYLGAGGHLVALRENDLAFLHVHPTRNENPIAFGATFPTAGRYRLFLQFEDEGRVQTVAFTKEVK